MKTLRTDRLVLRQAGDADAAFIAELMTDPGYLDMIGDRGVRSERDAGEYLRSALIYDYSDGLGFNIVEAAGIPVGICGLVKRPDYEAPDLGYAILGAHGGQGYATEAAKATFDHARRDLRMPQLLAITTARNTASRRVLARLGMTEEAPGQEDTETRIFRIRWNAS